MTRVLARIVFGAALVILGFDAMPLDSPFQVATILAGLGVVFSVNVLPPQGRNPRPGWGALPQARAMEMEEVEHDEERDLECVRVEFYHRPLTEDSIAELEREIELVLRRHDEAFMRALTGERKSIELHSETEWDSIKSAMPEPLSDDEKPKSPWDTPHR